MFTCAQQGFGVRCPSGLLEDNPDLFSGLYRRRALDKRASCLCVVGVGCWMFIIHGPALSDPFLFGSRLLKVHP